MSTTTANGNTAEQSSADKIIQQLHDDESHKAMIEDVPDEDDLRPAKTPASSSILESTTGDDVPSWAAPMSAKAAGKQKAREEEPKLELDNTQMFPGLGGGAPAPASVPAPQWTKSGKSNGTAAPSNSSKPASGVSTPRQQTPLSLPGKETQTVVLQTQDLLPKSQMKKAIPDVIKDINKKSRAKINMSGGVGGNITLTAAGPSVAICQDALNQLADQICAKTKTTVSIPQSARGTVVGKGGATIKSLQEKTGARIQIPKNDGGVSVVDDDDATCDVIIEGHRLACNRAQEEISQIAGERASATTFKLKGIPAEFYPFLAAHPELQQLPGGTRVSVPQYNKWSQIKPPQSSNAAPATFVASHPDNAISLSGDRQNVQAAKERITNIARALNSQLASEQFPLKTGARQFLIGKQGLSAQEFLAETGCHVILPTDPEDHSVTVIGPIDRIQAGVDRAMDLGSSMRCESIDIARAHRNAGAEHARNVTRYLQERREIERLQAAYDAVIDISSGSPAWQLFIQDGKASIRAQSEINSIVSGHPPSRMANVAVDPFYYKHLKDNIAPQVQQNHGVLVVVPKESEEGAELLLVYEGANAPETEYQLPRTAPSDPEVRAFQQGLADAQKYIMDLIAAQEPIKQQTVDVPLKFHDKLKRFIQREQQSKSNDEIPIRVTAVRGSTTITLRGPTSSVNSLYQKIEAFVAQETEDEKERGHQISFDFPQKHVNQLIGAGGSNIRALQEKFDVNLQVEDGKVTLTGPQAKADAAKAHILSQGKNWADERTHNLKVDQEFHRSLIGKGGETINKLQDRYNVQIMFPRAPRAENGAEDSEQGKGRRVQQPDEVVVRGPSKGADKARDEILELLQYYKDSSNAATIVVPQSQVGSLMGSGGRGIEEIRASTGATINVPNTREIEGDRVEIQIKGTKEQVAAAKKAIESKKAVLDATITKNLDVDRKYHSALIGSGGNALREIITRAGGPEDRSQQNRMVQFPKAGSGNNTIQVIGDENIVDAIIAAMQEIVEARESQVSDSVDVAVNKHRNLIGQGGSAKKQMEAQFGVQINVPRQGDGSTKVTISGQPSAVEAAKAHILELTREQEGETVQIPRNLHHSIADNGQFFRKLHNKKVNVDHNGQKIPSKPSAPNMSSNGASLPLITDDQEEGDGHQWIIVPNGSDEEGHIPWVLRGSADNVAIAKNMLAQALAEAELNRAIGYLSLADTSKHRYIIGTKGRKIDEIRNASGCKITVPREQGSYDPIEVLGSEEGVEMARALMLEAIREGGSRGDRDARN